MSENVFTEEQIQEFLREKLEKGEYLKCERFNIIMHKKMCRFNVTRYPLICGGCPRAKRLHR